MAGGVLPSRELAVSIFKLEQWRAKADTTINGALKEYEADAASIELDAAMIRSVGAREMCRTAHSGLIPVARTTSPQRSTSSRM